MVALRVLAFFATMFFFDRRAQFLFLEKIGFCFLQRLLFLLLACDETWSWVFFAQDSAGSAISEMEIRNNNPQSGGVDNIWFFKFWRFITLSFDFITKTTRTSHN